MRPSVLSVPIDFLIFSWLIFEQDKPSIAQPLSHSVVKLISLSPLEARLLLDRFERGPPKIRTGPEIDYSN
jgi:hypothetical protein